MGEHAHTTRALHQHFLGHLLTRSFTEMEVSGGRNPHAAKETDRDSTAIPSSVFKYEHSVHHTQQGDGLRWPKSVRSWRHAQGENSLPHKLNVLPTPVLWGVANEKFILGRTFRWELCVWNFFVHAVMRSQKYSSRDWWKVKVCSYFFHWPTARSDQTLSYLTANPAGASYKSMASWLVVSSLTPCLSIDAREMSIMLSFEKSVGVNRLSTYINPTQLAILTHRSSILTWQFICRVDGARVCLERE